MEALLLSQTDPEAAWLINIQCNGLSALNEGIWWFYCLIDTLATKTLCNSMVTYVSDFFSAFNWSSRLLQLRAEPPASDWPADQGAEHVHDERVGACGRGRQPFLRRAGHRSAACKSRLLRRSDRRHPEQPALLHWSHRLWSLSSPPAPRGRSSAFLYIYSLIFIYTHLKDY